MIETIMVVITEGCDDIQGVLDRAIYQVMDDSPSYVIPAEWTAEVIEGSMEDEEIKVRVTRTSS